MPLTSLPNELLSQLPLHMDSIETLLNAAATCRRLRDNFARTRPSTIMRLSAASTHPVFSPSPQLVIVATARQASDWARDNADGEVLLQKALQGGLEELYWFCVDHAGLTFDDLRLQRSRRDTVGLLARKMDERPTGGSPVPIEEAAHLIIYGELFGRDIEAVLPESKLVPFSIATRLKYWRFCAPVHINNYLRFCYISWPSMSEEAEHVFRPIALRDTNRKAWRMHLYSDTLQCQGLQWAQLVTAPTSEIAQEMLERKRRLAEQVAELEREPATKRCATRRRSHRISILPDPQAEMYAIQDKLLVFEEH